MDFLRARAIPALIACGLAAPALAADCTVDGAYQYRSEGSKDTSEGFNRLVQFKQGEGRKLFKSEGPPQPQQGWGGTEPRSRPKYTVLATRVEIAGPQVRFLDASGNLLVQATLDSGGKWTCSSGRLQRSSEHLTGIGDSVRTERLDESLRREGDVLVYSETRTTIDPPGGKPKAHEVRFRSAR